MDRDYVSRFRIPRFPIPYFVTPKNACTTLKYSLVVANGTYRDGASVHYQAMANRYDGSPLPEGVKSFIVLRDPVSRLLSAHYEKLINPSLGSFVRRMSEVILANKRNVTDPAAVGEDGQRPSLAELVRLINRSPEEELDENWRQQSTFFVLERYGTVFQMETLRMCWQHSHLAGRPISEEVTQFYYG